MSEDNRSRSLTPVGADMGGDKVSGTDYIIGSGTLSRPTDILEKRWDAAKDTGGKGNLYGDLPDILGAWTGTGRGNNWSLERKNKDTDARILPSA